MIVDDNDVLSEIQEETDQTSGLSVTNKCLVSCSYAINNFIRTSSSSSWVGWEEKRRKNFMCNSRIPFICIWIVIVRFIFNLILYYKLRERCDYLVGIYKKNLINERLIQYQSIINKFFYLKFERKKINRISIPNSKLHFNICMKK